MALIPNITVCLKSNCTELEFTETTGIYNASTNVGGYGTPNVNTTDIISANLLVIAPDDTEYNINMTLHDFPNSDNTIEYQLSLVNIGNRDKIEDGYWQFVYTLTDDDEVEYTVTKSYFFYCNAQCCVYTMLSTISVDALSTDELNNSKITNYQRVKTLLDSLKNASNCANETQFNKIKTLILKLCRNSSCRTCN